MCVILSEICTCTRVERTMIRSSTKKAPPESEGIFQESHAREILRPCNLDEYVSLDERGVWPSVPFDPLLPVETEELRWRPAQVFKDDLSSPDVLSTPALPFPFTARELAAFMLGGVGYFVAERYGAWNDGPNAEILGELDPSANRARAAVVAAFEAYRHAWVAVASEQTGAPDVASLVRYLLKGNVKPREDANEIQAPVEAPADGWNVLAKDMARAIIQRDKAKDLFPSQENIADEIARSFRESGVYGPSAKPLSGSYIKRHALKGISSATPRKLSTSIRRGKQGK